MGWILLNPIKSHDIPMIFLLDPIEFLARHFIRIPNGRTRVRTLGATAGALPRLTRAQSNAVMVSRPEIFRFSHGFPMGFCMVFLDIGFVWKWGIPVYPLAGSKWQ